jgi:hypothetical protein
VVHIERNLAVVDYAKNGRATRAAIERCPTGAIVWIDPKAGALKGLEAKTITRRSALPVEQVEIGERA